MRGIIVIWILFAESIIDNRFYREKSKGGAAEILQKPRFHAPKPINDILNRPINLGVTKGVTSWGRKPNKLHQTPSFNSLFLSF